jgi:hypothetical protein
MEKGMDNKRFATPLWVADGPRMIPEIACLEDAIDFLETLRDHFNGTLHDTALKACYRAASDLLAIEHAGRVLESFARMSRPLEDVPPQPWTIPQEAAERRTHARAAFTAYARVAGILARDSMQPVIAAPRGWAPIGTGLPH